MNEAAVQTLTARLARLAADVVGVDPGLAPRAATLAAGLDEPIRLAVVGRVGAGKSTLVNALVGRRIAPTDEAECTRVVTWYRWGTVDRAELHLLDGRVVPVRGDRGHLLPDRLPVPLSEVSHAVATVPEARLRRYTIIDTPGLASTTAEHEEATRRALLELGQADALLYAFRERELADDDEFVRAFARASGPRRGTAIDSIGVLSHADELGGGAWGADDPVEAARRTADSIAERHAGELAAVTAVAARTAEAAVTGSVTEDDAVALAGLADADPDLLRYGLDLSAGLDADGWERLRQRLGDHLVARGREHAANGAAALTGWAVRSSGIDGLGAELDRRCVGRHVQLRASRALDDLDTAADVSPHRARVRTLLAEALADDALHPLTELAAWRAVRARRPGSEMVRALDAVIDADDDRTALGLPPTAGAVVVREAARAARVANQRDGVLAISSAERRAAAVLDTSYRLITARWEGA